MEVMSLLIVAATSYLHILAPSILLHGSFDLIAFLVKCTFNMLLITYSQRRHRAVRIDCYPNSIAFGVYTLCRKCFGEAKYI